MKGTASALTIEQELREMNEALLLSSIQQHELAEQAQNSEAALRESEHRFRTLFELGPMAVYSCDASGVIQEFNRRAAELWGREPVPGDPGERFCGSFRKIRPDGSVLAHEQCPMAEVLRGEIPYAHDAEVHIDRPDGSRITVIVNIRPLKNEHGEITGAINCFYDITGRKQVEEVTARLAAIVAFSDDAIIGKDLNGIITSWNRGAQRLFGYTAEEVIGKSVTLLIPEDHLDEEPRILSSIRQGESVEHYDTVRRRKDGTLVDISLTVSPIKNSRGQVVGASKVARDITERKHAEQALRESEERFRQVADTMPQIVWAARPDGYIDYYNERWYEYTGFPRGEFGKSSWEPILHPDDVEPCVETYFGCIREGKPYEIEYRFKDRKTGGYRWFIGRALPIRNKRGEITRWFGTCTDIDDQKQATVAANEANLAKDIFLATLSHEMRTPLSAIVGWMHILHGGTKGECSDEEIDEGLDVIERNAQAMVELLNDVMDVSRIVSGKLRLEIRPCEMSKIVRDGVDVVRAAAQAKDITLSTEFDSAASDVSCDAARMQQVIWNLVSNAVKFTPKGGNVNVTLDRKQSDVRIQVSDSGQGIAPTLLPHVFDRFRQADSSTRRQFGGLGLGLSIVKHLVELHGGTVQAESGGDGRGATFTVLLPLRAVRMDENADESGAENEFASIATIGLPLVRLDGLRVLVVDDEPDARRLVVKVLQQVGAVVTAVSSAAEAIDTLGEAKPEVLVSDLGMPGQDGFELIRQIRALGRHAKDLPAVALSAFAHKNDQRQALLAGFQMHMPKPADPHDLTAVIASLAGRTGPLA